MRGIPREQWTKAVKDASAPLQIDYPLGRKPAQLPRGQCQRVAIDRSLVRSSLLCLFDESLLNLNARLSVEVRSEIKKQYQATGATMVYVTHDHYFDQGCQGE